VRRRYGITEPVTRSLAAISRGKPAISEQIGERSEQAVDGHALAAALAVSQFSPA